MDVLQLPFNQFLGLENSEAEGRLLRLPDEPKYQNHLGTVHAGALFALAEAASGVFLLRGLQERWDPESLLPVVRRAEIKYRKPAEGAVEASAVCRPDDWERFHEQLARKRRALIACEIVLTCGNDVRVAGAVYEWFVLPRA